jgi:prevent-host-death family protein
MKIAKQTIMTIIAILAHNFGSMQMKTMTAVEAKNSFGRLLEIAHREPVAVTKNNREIAAMFSMEDVNALAGEFLADPLKDDVAAGRLNVIEALMAQVDLNKRLAASRKAIVEGRGVVADSAYFAGLRTRALARTS